MAGGFSVVARSTFPKAPLTSGRIRGHLLNAMLKTSRDVDKVLDDITEAWRHKVPKTKASVKYAGGNALVTCHIFDDVFWYLNDGTDIRWGCYG